MDLATITPSIDVDDYSLADTCLLVRLEQKRVSTRRRADRATEQRIREQENDASLTINRHLFKKGPVQYVLTLMRTAYETHKRMTAPWVDKGPRILPGHQLEKYAERMEHYKDKLAEELPAVLRNWDTLVWQDMNLRSGSGQRTVSVDDYPTRERAAQAFSLEWYCDPVPKNDDFRVQVPEAVRSRQRDRLQLAVEGIRADLIQRMLEPVQAAAEKLSVPIGEKGHIFRDSLVQNLKDAVAQARALNVSNDADVEELVTNIERVLASGAENPQVLRDMQQTRERTAEQLGRIADRFRGLA